MPTRSKNHKSSSKSRSTPRRHSSARHSGHPTRSTRGVHNPRGGNDNYASSERRRSSTIDRLPEYEPRSRRDDGYQRQYEDYQSQHGQGDDRPGRRGFANMNPAERREISSRGGRASHGNQYEDYERPYRGDSEQHRYEEDYDYQDRRPGRRRDEPHQEEQQDPWRNATGEGNYAPSGRGYDPESSRRRHEDSEYTDNESHRPHRPQQARRGFAQMNSEERREIASRGGRASHGYGRGNGGDEYQHEAARRTKERADNW